jgi:hypothetical protein
MAARDIVPEPIFVSFSIDAVHLHLAAAACTQKGPIVPVAETASDVRLLATTL